MHRTAFSFAALVLTFCSTGRAFPASAQIPPSANADEIAKRAAQVLPHPRQVAWQEMEFTIFIHFGVNTFSGREWGTGSETPAIFNPQALDTRQWAAAAKKAGAKGIILTAKHHDGFCLWPSQFTEHTVKASPWRNGKGDVMAELSAACRKEGLKLGVYLSPADLNAIQRGVYGKTAAKKRVIPEPREGWTPKHAFKMEGTWDEYNAYFMNQLFELLTEYGDIFEVWFDGANPKPGTGQTYAYQDWYRLIRALQPNAVIFGKGPDVRWIGNEAGGSRPAEWSVVGIPVAPESFDWSDMTGRDLGSRERLKGAPHLVWYPAETDVSIRPGWFWHGAEDNRVKSLEQLMDIYLRSAGGNSLLLLNVPPDTNGLISKVDIKRLEEFGDLLRATFATNHASGAVASSSTRPFSPGFEPSRIVDGNARTCWRTEDGVTSAEIIVTLPKAQRFNIVQLKEDIARFGQRVERFAVDVDRDGSWKEIAQAQTIGHQKFLRIAPVETSRLRVRFLESRVCPTLSEFGLFMEPVRPTPPQIRRDKKGFVTLWAPAGLDIYYTINGTGAGSRYTKPFDLSIGGEVTAKTVVAGADPASKQSAAAEATMVFGPSKLKWKAVSFSSEEAPEEAAAFAIDDDPDTVWHTAWKKPAARHPHEIVIDMEERLPLEGFTYLPRPSGVITREYEFYTSTDGRTWDKPAAAGEFGNIRNNPIQQVVHFPPRYARYFKFVSKSEVEGKAWTCVPELGVIVQKR